MAGEQVEERDMPEAYGSITHTEIINTGGAALTKEVIAVRGHPKMRLVDAQVTPLVHDTAGNVYTIEKGDGTNLTDALTASTTALNGADFTPVEGVEIARNESVQVLCGSEGGANTVGMLTMRFETIH